MAMADAPRRLQMIQLRMQLQQQEDAAALAILLQRRRRRQQRRQRQYWVRPWVARRLLFGNYENLMVELEREAQGDFINFLRMEPAMFHELVLRLTPRLTKQTTRFRKPLEPGLKLAITLRHLASGDSYHSLSYLFRVPHNTISMFVKDVCEAIVAEYGEAVVTLPTTGDAWRDVAQAFSTRWNFHHAVGAIDGKHIAIKAPKDSGSVYYNYKGFFSIILLGLVDANYKFMWVDVGANGSTSDCAVFNASNLKDALESGTLGLPVPEPLPDDDRDIPYFIVGDDAFPLKTWLMKPFAIRNMTHEERIFNYRLSRARRIVENAFGILANRFQCLLTTLKQEPETVQSMSLACVCLHNLMRIRYPALQNAVIDREGGNHELIPGAWRHEGIMQEVHGVQGGNAGTREAKQQRIYLKHYYSIVGAVPWQDAMI